MTQRGDELLSQVLTNSDEDAPRKLLSEFYHGFPVERLRELFQSSNQHVVEAGAWIAWELGDQIKPLLRDMVRLLEHPYHHVRFYAVDLVWVAAGEQDGDAVALAILMIQDVEKSVRFIATRFLSRASSRLLASAIPHLDSKPVAACIKWLVESERADFATSEFARCLGSTDQVQRLVAVAVATRRRDRQLLELSAASADPEVAEFARDMIETEEVH